jgi:hypothetical protein
MNGKAVILYCMSLYYEVKWIHTNIHNI